LLPEESRPDLSEIEQETLTDYAVINRYPGSPVVGATEAAEAVRLAGKIREFVRSKLPSQALIGKSAS